MMCKDCKVGYKFDCFSCGEEVIICLATPQRPELINSKYWKDEEGCQGI